MWNSGLDQGYITPLEYHEIARTTNPCTQGTKGWYPYTQNVPILMVELLQSVSERPNLKHISSK
jgi:hypothetical protein